MKHYSTSNSADAQLLQDVILGQIEADHPVLPGRLVVLRARFHGRAEAGMLVLIDRALEAHGEAVRRAEVAADRAFLQGLIDGSGDLLSEDTFPRMEPMFPKYAQGSEMFLLVEAAAEAFSKAVQDAATWAMAGWAIDDARWGWTEE